MIGRKRRIVVKPVYDFKTSGRAEGHAHGHMAVQFDHRRRRKFRQWPVKARDSRPIRFGQRRVRAHGGDLCLERIGTGACESKTARGYARVARLNAAESQGTEL
jgi:hypothetical protein